MPTSATVLPWLLRASWAVLPVVAGPALSAALDPRDVGLRTVASLLVWTVWVTVLLAMLVPSTVSLTVFRLAVPAALLAAIVAALTGCPSPAASLGALLVTAVAATIGFLPETSLFYVNGRSYPNERRLPLRPPGPLLFGPLPLAWALVVVGPALAIGLLASKRWVAGGIVAAVVAPLALVLIRSLHTLSKRWVVLVPAGLVLHDPIALLDPVLFSTKVIEQLGPAPAGSDSLDLTQGAPGLALELVLREKVPMTLSKPGTHAGEAGASARLLFTPTRPGLVLQEAAARGVPLSPTG